MNYVLTYIYSILCICIVTLPLNNWHYIENNENSHFNDITRIESSAVLSFECNEISAHGKGLIQSESEVERLFKEGRRIISETGYGGLFFAEASRKLDTLDIDPVDYNYAGLLYIEVSRRADATKYLEAYYRLFPELATAETFAGLTTNYGYAFNVDMTEYYYDKTMNLLQNRDLTFSLSRRRLVDEMDIALLVAYVFSAEFKKGVEKGEEIVQNLASEQPAAQVGWTNLFNYYPAALARLNRHDEAIHFLEDQIKLHGPESTLGQWATMYKILTRYDQLLSKKGKAAAIEFIDDAKSNISNTSVLSRLNTNISHLKLIGEKMPDLVIDDWLGEKQFDPKQLEGKVVVLDFWSSWCGPCRAAFPKMNAIYNEYKDHGLRVIGITTPYGYVSFPKRGIIRDLSYEEEVYHTRNFVKEMDLVFPQFMDKEGTNFRNFSVGFLPTIVVIDRNGIIQYINFMVDTSVERLIHDLVHK